MPLIELERPTARVASRAAISTDPAGVIRHATPAAEELLGYDRRELVGRSLRSLHVRDELAARATSDVPDDLDPVFAPVRSGVAVVDRQRWTYVRRDATTLPVRATVTAVCGRGEVTAFIVLVEPMAERTHHDEMHVLEILRRLLHGSGEPARSTAVQPVALDLAEVVVSALQALACGLDAKRISLTLDVTGAPVVLGCPLEVRTLVDRLLDEAVRAAPLDGRLTVAVLVEGDECRFVCSAHGAGPDRTVRLPRAGSPWPAVGTEWSRHGG